MMVSKTLISAIKIISLKSSITCIFKIHTQMVHVWPMCVMLQFFPVHGDARFSFNLKGESVLSLLKDSRTLCNQDVYLLGPALGELLWHWFLCCRMTNC